MNLSKLKGFFDGRVDQIVIKNSLLSEMDDYKRGNFERGRSKPVLLKEDTELFFHKESLRKLYLSFIECNFLEIEINYIADALLLSESTVFSSEDIKEKLEELTDPEINGRLTTERVQEMLKQLDYI